jgi:hypothetical protein
MKDPIPGLPLVDLEHKEITMTEKQYELFFDLLEQIINSGAGTWANRKN